MPPRQWRLFVADIVDALQAIDSYTAGLTREQFCGDRLRVDAVIKNLTVIGEAAGRVPADVTEANARIPWSRMRAMRNVVVHEYFGVDARILWETVKGDLPPLVPKLQAVLTSG